MGTRDGSSAPWLSALQDLVAPYARRLGFSQPQRWFVLLWQSSQPEPNARLWFAARSELLLLLGLVASVLQAASLIKFATPYGLLRRL